MTRNRKKRGKKRLFTFRQYLPNQTAASHYSDWEQKQWAKDFSETTLPAPKRSRKKP